MRWPNSSARLSSSRTTHASAYVYAIALHSAGQVQPAISKLEKALSRHPTDSSILQALVTFHAKRGDAVQAKRYADQLRLLSQNR